MKHITRHLLFKIIMTHHQLSAGLSGLWPKPVGCLLDNNKLTVLDIKGL